MNILVKGLILILVAVSTAIIGKAQSGNPTKTVTFRGTVVAESNQPDLGCWHVCTLFLVVRIDNVGAPHFVEVAIAYMEDRARPQNGTPLKLIKCSKNWEFKALRDGQVGLPLREYLEFINLENGKDVSADLATPAWILVKGAENVKLPFGESLRTYKVSVGKFKPVR